MISVTCIVHFGEVDDSNAVELPHGWCCIPCFMWMESMMDDGEIDIEYEVVLVSEDYDDDE